MQAIEVKYVGASNYRGSRWRASCASGSVSIPYDSGTKMIPGEENAAVAAQALCAKLGWSGTMHGGQLKNGNWVFVFEDSTFRHVPKGRK
jgi:hypothetical protein